MFLITTVIFCFTLSPLFIDFPKTNVSFHTEKILSADQIIHCILPENIRLHVQTLAELSFGHVCHFSALLAHLYKSAGSSCCHRCWR